MQWFKAFYDQSGTYRDDYVPSSVRVRGKGGSQYNEKFGSSGAASSSSLVSSGRSSAARSAACSSGSSIGRGGSGAALRPTAATTTTAKKAVAARPQPEPKATAKVQQKPPPSSPRLSRPLRERVVDNDDATTKKVTVLEQQKTALTKKNADLQTKSDELELKNIDLQTKVEELELAVLEIEKERDFYFEKLRNVEVMLQVHQEKSDGDRDVPAHLVENIFKVLYASAEDSIVVNDEGEVVDASFLSESEVVDAV